MIYDRADHRRRNFILGGLLALLVMAGAGLLAMLKPHADIGEASILATRTHDQLFYRADQRIYPVDSLATARLLSDEPAQPITADSDQLADFHWSQPINLNGPAPLPATPQPTSAVAHWLVCASADGPHSGAPITIVATDHARATNAIALTEQGLWLLYDGYRTRLSAGERPSPTVERAFGLSGAPQWHLPQAVIDPIPRGPDIDELIRAARSQGTSTLAAPLQRQGTIVRTEQRYYVVRERGIAPIAPILAELLAAQPGAARVELSEADIANIPTAAPPQWKHLPDTAPHYTEPDVADESVDTRRNTANNSPNKQTTQNEQQLLCGAPEGPMLIHHDPTAATAATQTVHYRGPAEVLAVDTGHSYFLIDPSGHRYAVADLHTLQVLGYTSVEPAPWKVIRNLPAGGTLSHDIAEASLTKISAGVVDTSRK